MSQHDCCEPWYQCDTFTYGDAVAALTYCLKGKIEDGKMLEALIKETVSEKTDFGSSRGYYTFLHTKYKNDILERFRYLTCKVEKKNKN